MSPDRPSVERCVARLCAERGACSDQPWVPREARRRLDEDEGRRDPAARDLGVVPRTWGVRRGFVTAFAGSPGAA